MRQILIGGGCVRLWAFKYWEELLWFLALIVGSVIALYLVRFLLWLLAPFILAWLLTIVLRPFIRFFDRHLNFGRPINVALVMLLVVGFGSVILFFLITRLVFETKRLLFHLPFYFEQIRKQLESNLSAVREVAEGFSPGLSIAVERGLAGLTGQLEKLTGQVMQFFFQLSFGLPDLLIILIVALVAAYFFSLDYERIKRGIQRLVPAPWRESFGQALSSSSSALAGVLRAQLILFGIAFLELLLGFWLLGVKHWVLIAFLILLVDILPILGTGFILIPWIIWSFIVKAPVFAFSLLALYLVILITRNLLTPKLYGESFGLDPLATLVAMYVGLKLIGLWGLILAPFVLMICLVFWKKIRAAVNQNKLNKRRFPEPELTDRR